MSFVPGFSRFLPVLFLAAACSSASGGAAIATTVAISTITEAPVASSAAPTAPETAAVPTTMPTTVAPTTVIQTTAVPTTTMPQFSGAVREIDATVETRITPTSWREGCPVSLEALRYVEVSHWDDEGQVQMGELIVAAEHAEGMVQVFETLFAAGFPIHQMRLVDAYDGDDQLSMQANNTSAFNCREVAYTPGRWSNHAFGAAIDINPLVNPYVRGDFVDPAQGAPFVDRSRTDVTGLIAGDSVVVQAFAEIGWAWGGNWNNSKDYQHFSASGS